MKYNSLALLLAGTVSVAFGAEAPSQLSKYQSILLEELSIDKGALNDPEDQLLYGCITNNSDLVSAAFGQGDL